MKTPNAATYPTERSEGPTCSGVAGRPADLRLVWLARIGATVALGALLASTPQSQAQQGKDQRPPQAATPAPASTVPVPDTDRLLALIRTSLLTLNDAMQTGNFSVMRDRAAPAFQAVNTAARLSQIFAELTAQGLDLSSIAVVVPKLTAQPVVDAQNRLHISGLFSGQPFQFVFDLTFEPVAGQWRLFEIAANAVATAPPAAGTPAAAPPAATNAAKKAPTTTPPAPATAARPR